MKQMHKIKLMGMWNDHTANVEVTRHDDDMTSTITISRPFSAKEMTLTVSEALELADALKECAEAFSRTPE